jgi:hypothetical protein
MFDGKLACAVYNVVFVSITSISTKPFSPIIPYRQENTSLLRCLYLRS